MKTRTRGDIVAEINKLNSEIKEIRESLGYFHDPNRRLRFRFKKVSLLSYFRYITGELAESEMHIPNDLAKIIREWFFEEIIRKEEELDQIIAYGEYRKRETTQQ